MSLARKLNGCYECSRRRIKCDKAEPQCLKCQKKGIQCSGQGIRYRFSDGHTSRKRKSPQTAQRKLIQASDTTNVSCEPATGSITLAGRIQPHEDVEQAHQALVRPQNHLQSDSSNVYGLEICYPDHGVHREPGIQAFIRACLNPQPHAAIEILDPRTRMLFHHFSEAVAPIMVVLDTESNGYRDIILPLACEDEVVQSAVSVVAAFHLAAKMPELQRPAELGQMNIISRLRRDSLLLPSHRLFNVSTWATILVLLIGETVTGGNDFIYLLEMLKCLTRTSGADLQVPASVPRFFLEQTKMFELFGFPLSHELKGIKILQRPPDHYLDFISYPLAPTSDHYTNIKQMKEGIRIACEVYRRRAESMLSPNESIDLLEQLRLSVVDINNETEGSHALVWAYFIGAAESVLPYHREFFTNRLRAMFDRTKFRNIPVALKALEKIWAMQGFRRWTEVIVNENPILVM